MPLDVLFTNFIIHQIKSIHKSCGDQIKSRKHLSIFESRALPVQIPPEVEEKPTLILYWIIRWSPPTGLNSSLSSKNKIFFELGLVFHD